MLKTSKLFICGLAALLGLSACSSGLNESNPDDSSNEESKYQVSQEYWTNNITQFGYFGVNSNITMNIKTTYGNGFISEGLIANANGNIRIYSSGEETNLEMFVKTNSDQTFDVYMQGEDGEWIVTTQPASFATSLMSTYSNFINPWLYTDFTYNKETHAYEKDSYLLDLGSLRVDLQDIAFKFENNKLVSLSYRGSEDGQSFDFLLTASLQGSTVVTFPKIKTGEDDKPTSLALSEEEVTVKMGDKVTLTAVILPATITNVEVNWVSSDSSIAEVELTGAPNNLTINVKGHMEGTAIVTASIEGGLTATCKVNVTKDETILIPATSIEVTSTSLNLKVGDEVTLTATVSPANATNKLVHWSADKKGVIDLTVSGENNVQATIKATGVGTCEITAIVTLGVEARCSVTVTDDGTSTNVSTDVITNKKFVYKTYLPADDSFAGNDVYHQAETNATVSFFDDDTFEYHVYGEVFNTSNLVQEKVYRGTFTIENTTSNDPVNGEGKYLVSCKAKDYIENDEVNNLTLVYFDFYYSVNEKSLFKYVEDVKHYEADGSVTHSSLLLKYLLSNELPQRYSLSSYDNWDDVEVKRLLQTMGYNDELPRLDNVKTFDIRNNGDDSFIIVCGFVDNSTASEANTIYARELAKTFTPTSQYIAENGDYVLYYVSPNNEYKVEFHINANNNYLQITILNAIAKYPSDDVNKYLASKGYTDTLPELKSNDVSSYALFVGYNALDINFDASLKEKIQGELITILTDARFDAKEIRGVTYYLSLNKQFAVYFSAQDYGLCANFLPTSELPIIDYPAREISDYCRGVTESYPDFSYSGDATYTFEGPSGVYLDAFVTVSLDEAIPEDKYVNEFIPSLKALLEGWTHYKTITVSSEDGATKDYRDIYISPNRQIAIRIVSDSNMSPALDEAGNVVAGRGIYKIQFVNLITYRLVNADDGQPHLDSITATGMTTEYEVGDTFAFDGILTASYTNGGEDKEVTPTSVSSIDMSVAANNVAVTITYTEDDVTKQFVYYINIVDNSPQLVRQILVSVDEFDIFKDDAQFKVWAWGGEYGAGTWVEFTSIDKESRNFVVSLYDNCEGFQVVRIDPNNMPSDEHSRDGVVVWNQTGDMTLSVIGRPVNFKF